jgi:septum formation topological specificity factor MinE
VGGGGRGVKERHKRAFWESHFLSCFLVRVMIYFFAFSHTARSIPSLGSEDTVAIFYLVLSASFTIIEGFLYVQTRILI